MILKIIFWIVGLVTTACGHVLIWNRMPSVYSKVNKLALMFFFTIIYCLLLLGLAYAFTQGLSWKFASAVLASGLIWLTVSAFAVNIKKTRTTKQEPAEPKGV